MKRLLSKGLVYCATLVLTGRACKATIPSKLKSTIKPMHSDRILNKHQAYQQNKVKDQGILKTIDITMQEAFEMEACLKEYLTKLESLNHIETRAQSHTTSTIANDHAYNGEMVQCASRSTILEKTEQEQKQIPNVRPISKREAIQPIQFFTSDFKSNVANVHKHIPDIEKLHIDKTLKKIEDRINMIIDTRKKDDDTQLTDAQKEKLREIKLIIRKEKSPCWYVIYFYSLTSKDIDKKNGTIDSSYLDWAKNINRALSDTVEQTNKLLRLMEIPINKD